MTNEEIWAAQRKEQAFFDTPIGRAFHRFKHAHSRYWQQDASETISDERLRELSEAADKAERTLRDLIEPVAHSSAERQP